MTAKTTIYKFDREGNLISTRVRKELEIKIRKRGGAFIYSVILNGKIIHAGLVGSLDECAYCHEKISGRPKKLGILNFHYECFLKFYSWQRKIRPRHPRRKPRKNE